MGENSLSQIVYEVPRCSPTCVGDFVQVMHALEESPTPVHEVPVHCVLRLFRVCIPPHRHRACPLVRFPHTHPGVGLGLLLLNLECRAGRQCGTGGSRHCVGGALIVNLGGDGCQCRSI